jgi:hypothetical protein
VSYIVSVTAGNVYWPSGQFKRKRFGEKLFLRLPVKQAVGQMHLKR